jgi:triacylglycerol lipase
MVSRAIEAAKAQGAANKLIWITGHSLGGAMALLFAYDCLQTKALGITGLVTFGQPMVVDGRLAAYLNAELDGRYLRFVNGDDLVPLMVPFYSHCGKLVYFIDNTFKSDKPTIRAAAAKADELAEALAYEHGPQPMSKEEFDRIKSNKSRRLERRKDRRRSIEPEAQAAAVEDHDMSRYLHWIGLFAGQAKVKPMASPKS